MKLATRSISYFATFVLATSTLRLTYGDNGQQIEFRVVSGRDRASQIDLINKRLAAVERDLDSGLFDPTAEALLAADQAYTKGIFRFPGLLFKRAATRRDSGDIVVAEWSVNEPFATGVMMLEDTPVASTYTLRLTGCAIHSMDELSAFLLKLMAWGVPPLEISPVRIDLPSTDAAPKQFSGSTMRAAVSIIYDFGIHAALAGNEWLITIRIGKGMMGSHYPLPPFVPERFPALAELAKSWTPERISQEIGRTVDLKPQVMDFTGARDEILITELSRRGLTEDQFLNLLVVRKPSRDALRERAQVVTASLKRTDRQASLWQYFGTGIDLYEKLGSVADDAVAVLFRSVAYARCTPEIEGRAVTLLRQGIFLDGALLYLGQCSSSPETLRAIEPVVVPSGLRDEKEIALQNIRARVGQDRR